MPKPSPTSPNEQKLLTALRNATAWLQSAANLARTDGRQEVADAIHEESKSVMNLTSLVVPIATGESKVS